MNEQLVMELIRALNRVKDAIDWISILLAIFLFLDLAARIIEWV
jgi:hypothetical protein